MDLTMQTAEAVAAPFQHVHFGFMGDSGTGKSRLVALMPDPLIVEVEGHGLNTVRQWNQKAVVIPLFQDDSAGSYTGKPYGSIRDPKIKCRMLEHIIDAIFAGHPQPDGSLLVPSWRVDDKGNRTGFLYDKAVRVRSFCIDTTNELQVAMLEAMLGRKVADESEDDISGKIWTRLKYKTHDLFRTMRDMPLHTLAVGHVSEKEQRGSLKASLAFFGKTLGPEVPRYCTAFGWLVKQSQAEGVRFCAVFEGASDLAITKGVAGLRAVEQLPDDVAEGGPQDWIERILTAQPGAGLGVPEAPGDIDLEGARWSMEQAQVDHETEKAKRKAEEDKKTGGLGAGGRRASVADLVNPDQQKRGRRAGK